MTDKKDVTTGYSKNGLPYFRIGTAKQTVFVFEGLNFENKPPSGFQLRWVTGDFKRLAEDYTVYSVGRKPHLPQGYSTRDMAKDYADMIKNEVSEPVNVIGLSTGGTIAQYFALDYPALTRHLILASTGYKLTENGKKLQLNVAEMVRQNKYRKAFTAMLDGLYPNGGIKKQFFKLMMWLMAKAPEEPSDLQVTIEAEDKHYFKDFLSKINLPTLVIGGEDDFFYPIFETAQGIPNAELKLYKGFGHNAWLDNRKQFQADMLKFLKSPNPKFLPVL